MIYLIRSITADDGKTTIDITACEDADHAAPYEARGFDRCTLDAYRAGWRAKDAQAMAGVRASLGLAPRVVATETAPLGAGAVLPGDALAEAFGWKGRP
jgi:hypothetical protein